MSRVAWAKVLYPGCIWTDFVHSVIGLVSLLRLITGIPVTADSAQVSDLLVWLPSISAMTSSCTNTKAEKRIKNNDSDNDDDDDDDDDNNNLSREEVSFDNVKNVVATRNLYLLTCVLVYLLSYPPHILPWFNKVILSLWLTLFNTTETCLKAELSLTARSITSFSIECSWIVTAKRRTTMVLEERVLTSADLRIVWLPEFLA